MVNLFIDRLLRNLLKQKPNFTPGKRLLLLWFVCVSVASSGRLKASSGWSECALYYRADSLAIPNPEEDFNCCGAAETLVESGRAENHVPQIY